MIQFCKVMRTIIPYGRVLGAGSQRKICATPGSSPLSKWLRRLRVRTNQSRSSGQRAACSLIRENGLHPWSATRCMTSSCNNKFGGLGRTARRPRSRRREKRMGTLWRPSKRQLPTFKLVLFDRLSQKRHTLTSSRFAKVMPCASYCRSIKTE